MSRRLNVEMVYQTIQIMDEQKTKAKRKTPSCIFSVEEHPECCTFFLIHTLALIEFVSCHWDSTMYKPSMPHSCLILATPYQTSCLLVSTTQLTVWSMEMSRSWWGNPPVAWADHFLSAISPRWAQQSRHMCTVRGRWCSPNGTGVGGGWGPLFGFSECVGLGPSRLKAFCFLSVLTCDSG